ncbi:glycoside hydrolase family 43 protein [Actinomadura gamaensis]|uniref:Glycoside hydrolase family 43 protein n=1 Tax=Actinomadura gamaensis TaxID=1763541 RepID=A0ABV9UDK5_9ACTN
MKLPSRRSAAVGTALAVVVAGGGAAAWATSSESGRPAPAGLSADASAAASGPKLVIPTTFADPGVLKVGRTYYAYSTNTKGRTLPVATAASMRGPWSIQPADALPKLGAWASGGLTWGPDVARRADGSYVLYYTAHSKARGTGCVGAAVAKSPLGPFSPVGTGPLVCDAPKEASWGRLRGEIIGAAAYGESGRRYLVYKVGYNGANPWKPSFLLLQKLSADGLHRVGAPRVILKQTNEPYTTEAPYLVKHGGSYVLFYSSGLYSRSKYETRYAVSSKLGGPYKKAGTLMTTQSLRGKVNGPGSASVLRDGNTWWIVFHGALDYPAHPTWPSKAERPNPLVRGMYVAELGWSGSRPHLR